MTRPMTAVSALALSAALLGCGPALAQATPQGAADLTAVFQTYLSSTPGVVNVVADGDGYAVTLDATPLLAKIPAEAGARAMMTPYRMRLRDNGDGTWATSEDQAIRLDIAVPGLFQMRVAASRIACEGTFDARLMAFAQSDCTVEGMEVSQVVEDPLQGRSETTQRVDRMTVGLSGAAGQGGGVDMDVTYSAAGISQVMDVPMGPGALPLRIDLTLDTYEADLAATGMRTGAMLGIAAWFVANPEPGLMMANRGQIKTILSDGLPLWELIGGVVTGTGLTVNTPVGPATAETLEVEIELAGAVENGLFREAIRVAGVRPPPGVLPPFLEPLLPTEAAIDFAVEDYDAAAAARLLLGLFDLPPGADPGPEFEGRMMQALMPGGTVTISFAEGGVANATYRLDWEGRITAGPGRMPAGSGTVTATGYDAAMALVDALPDEMKDAILPGMGMARGLARDGGDGTLVWDIDATQPGTFKVNGMDLMGMQ